MLSLNRSWRLLPLLASLLGTLCALPAGAADAFPDKPIRLVVPFPPGGGADGTARLVAQKLGARLGQSVVVDNRAGANGSIGTTAVAKSTPDGYTLLLVDRGALGINPSLYRKLPYDPLKELAFVGIAAWSPYVLVENPSRAPRSWPALVAAAKGAPPCKANYASFGNGSMAQMGMESLNAHFGTCITHVPYKGGGPALMAAVSGEVDVTLATIGPAMPLIKDGRLVPLFVSGAKRSKLLPQTPAITELGASADLVPATWFGFAYPQNTPQAIVQRMAAEIRAVVESPEVQARLVDDGFEPGAVDPAQMAAEVRNDIERFGKLAERIGIKPE